MQNIFKVLCLGFITILFIFIYSRFTQPKINILQDNTERTDYHVDKIDYFVHVYNQNLNVEFSYPHNLKLNLSERSYESSESNTSMGFDNIVLRSELENWNNSSISIIKVRNNKLSAHDYFNIKNYSFNSPGEANLGDKIQTLPLENIGDYKAKRLVNPPLEIPIQGVSAEWIIIEDKNNIYILERVFNDESKEQVDKAFETVIESFKLL